MLLLCCVLQELAHLNEDHIDLIKALMHGSKDPQRAYPSAPWLFDVVSTGMRQQGGVPPGAGSCEVAASGAAALCIVSDRRQATSPCTQLQACRLSLHGMFLRLLSSHAVSTCRCLMCCGCHKLHRVAACSGSSANSHQVQVANMHVQHVRLARAACATAHSEVCAKLHA